MVEENGQSHAPGIVPSRPDDRVRSPFDVGRLIAGATIILLGALLLLDRAGLIHWVSRTAWWPILAIGFGVARLLSAERHGVQSGLFFLWVGAWGLLNEWNILRYEDSWPLLLVGLGGSMILSSLFMHDAAPIGASWAPHASGLDRRELRRLRRLERRQGDGVNLLWLVLVVAIVMSIQSRTTGPNGGIDSDTDVHRTAVLKRSQTVTHANRLQRGSVTAIMGQCELDLTHATVAPGDEPTIDVVALMGQVTLIVPSDWTLEIRTIPALGNVRDRRLRSTARGSDAPLPDRPVATATAPHVVLRGTVTMGNLLIKD